MKSFLAESQTAESRSPKSHGRREHRSITVTSWSVDRLRELGWPGVGQVFELVRTRQVKGKNATREVVYGFTSLDARQASPERLLELSRGHWGIENELHGVRDGTLGEDRCRVRKGQSARVLASLRNVAVHVLTGQVRAKVGRNRAEVCRRNGVNPAVPLRLLNRK